VCFNFRPKLPISRLATTKAKGNVPKPTPVACASSSNPYLFYPTSSKLIHQYHDSYSMHSAYRHNYHDEEEEEACLITGIEIKLKIK